MANPGISTRKQRTLWYRQVYRCGKSVKEVCKIFGISRKCFYYWKNHDLGITPYHSPKRQPNLKLTSELRTFIEKTKWKTNYGPCKMKLYIKKKLNLDLSTTIIYRFYKKRRLIRRPQRKLPWYEPLKHHLIIEKPGQGVQMDVKYVYEDGRRKYQFSALDPFTKKFYFHVFPTRHSKHASITFQEAESYWGFKIVSVQTDNGSEFRGEFHDFLTEKLIPHYFIPKHSPYWNGKVERAHKTIDDEYYHNPYRVWRTAYEWLAYYNFERIHLTLGGLTPHEAFKKV